MPLPNSKYAPTSPGLVSREKLSQIYNDYVESYEKLVAQTGTCIPTLFLIFSEKGEDNEEPIAYPVNMEVFESDEKIESILSFIANSFSPDKYNLEMIIYSQLAVDNDEVQSLMFGGRDLTGTTIHTLFKVERAATTGGTKLVRREIGGDSFHTWIPADKKDLPFDRINDEFLKKISAHYAVASSMVALSL